MPAEELEVRNVIRSSLTERNDVIQMQPLLFLQAGYALSLLLLKKGCDLLWSAVAGGLSQSGSAPLTARQTRSGSFFWITGNPAFSIPELSDRILLSPLTGRFAHLVSIFSAPLFLVRGIFLRIFSRPLLHASAIQGDSFWLLKPLSCGAIVIILLANSAGAPSDRVRRDVTALAGSAYKIKGQPSFGGIFASDHVHIASIECGGVPFNYTVAS